MNSQPQTRLFQEIKSKLPPSISLADAVAQTLGIGPDSAYRRIRGEKPLSMDELLELSTHYKVSLDQLAGSGGDGFYFQGVFVDPASFRFDKYLQGVVNQLQLIGSMPQRHMYYLCKDIPVFYHFQYRDLAAFKYYFWMKAIVNHPDFIDRPFSFDDYSDELFALGTQVLDAYNHIPSTEMWNVESINSTLQQIDYYRYTNMFVNDHDLLRVYDALEQLVVHLEQNAGSGTKAGDAAKTGQSAAFFLYHNEMFLGDNSILAATANGKMAFLVHSVINYIITRDLRFCEHLHANIQNLLKRCTLISTDNERERNDFFRQLYRKIDLCRQSLKN